MYRSIQKRLNQRKITDYFARMLVKGYNHRTREWHCLVCGENMGLENSRQLCRKWYCPLE